MARMPFFPKGHPTHFVSFSRNLFQQILGGNAKKDASSMTRRGAAFGRRFLPKQSHGYSALIDGIASSLRFSQRQKRGVFVQALVDSHKITMLK